MHTGAGLEEEPVCGRTSDVYLRWNKWSRQGAGCAEGMPSTFCAEPANQLQLKGIYHEATFYAGNFLLCSPSRLQNAPSSLPALSPWRTFSLWPSLLPQHFPSQGSSVCSFNSLLNSFSRQDCLLATLPHPHTALWVFRFSPCWPCFGLPMGRYQISPSNLLQSLPKIPISGSGHLLHFYDQSSYPSRMFSIPGSLRSRGLTGRGVRLESVFSNSWWV